jgi:hypothetical protein
VDAGDDRPLPLDPVTLTSEVFVVVVDAILRFVETANDEAERQAAAVAEFVDATDEPEKG